MATSETRKEGLSALLTVSPLLAYGKNLFRPLNDLAVGLADFAGCKNFTEEQLRKLTALGFHVEIPPPTFGAKPEGESR